MHPKTSRIGRALSVKKLFLKLGAPYPRGFKIFDYYYVLQPSSVVPFIVKYILLKPNLCRH